MQVDFADPTLMETESFSGILFNIADVVSRHQDGASTRNDRGEELHDSVSSCRIEISGRFVSQNHLEGYSTRHVQSPNAAVLHRRVGTASYTPCFAN